MSLEGYPADMVFQHHLFLTSNFPRALSSFLLFNLQPFASQTRTSSTVRFGRSLDQNGGCGSKAPFSGCSTVLSGFQGTFYGFVLLSVDCKRF